MGGVRIPEDAALEDRRVRVKLGGGIQPASRVIEIDVPGGVEPGVLGRPKRIERPGPGIFRIGSQKGCLRGYFASGSGRTWNLTTLLVVPRPVSMWNGVRVLTVDHSPFPFHPAFGSSMRPSSHLA